MLGGLPFWRRRRGVGDAIRREGPRVAIRPLRMDDDAAMYAYASDPEVTRYLPWHPAPGVDTVRSFLLQQLSRRRRGESMGMAVELRATGEMIGSTDLMGLLAGEPGRAELGYLLSRDHWGQGLMTEAAGLTLDLGFETLNLTRVEAYADTDNHGSRRVLEKVGMRTTGTENRMVKNEERLYVRYAITRGEWEARGGRERGS